MKASTKILVVAGEASGDRLAGRALNHAIALAGLREESLELYGIGGPECKALGMDCIYSTDQMSVVGFLEVAKRYFFFRNVLKEIIALLDSKARRPDILFLIDYPGFNLRLAKEARKRGIRVVFYVSPQVWAWKAGRVQDIVATVDDMLVIFPFEVEIYTKAGLKNTHFVGHPLLEIIAEEARSFSSREAFASTFGLDPNKEWLVIFPGSRREEVGQHGATMIAAAKKFIDRKDWQAIMVESESVPHSDFSHEDGEIRHFRSSRNIHELMHHAQLGILKSGTTTLEAALSGLPGVICYKTSAMTYQLAKRMITLKFIGLANIVLGKKLYPELIQSVFTAATIAENLERVWSDRAAFKESLQPLGNILKAPNDSPSKRVAEILLTNA